MNYFAYKTAAERYAKSRPYFHPLVIEKIRAFLGLVTPVSHALDVACGTGQSSKALLAIADKITGTDLSEEMLEFARTENAAPTISYLCSPAETLPFSDNTFDLITVSLAFHWFERSKFLSEACRVLKNTGWLAIYGNNFAAMMKENPEFTAFVKEVYFARYPTPKRHHEPLTDEIAQPFGFELVSSETYSNEVVFTVESLVNYLMTHSNVITKVEQGTETVEEVYTWLTEQTSKFLMEGEGTFVFKGDILYLQSRANPTSK